MTTISRLLREAAASIGAASDSPRLDAEILLAHVTGKTRTFFMAWPEGEIASAHAAEFERLIERRRAGEPVSYLTGTREFWSREFLVTPDVLIPRPETELLVEIALEKVPADRPVRILDLGTGSGAIAVTLALELPLAHVAAVDYSPAALAVAQSNAKRLGACNVRFLLGDWFEALGPEDRFDLIVSNPPYIEENDPHLSQGDVRFEPPSALSSGADGLDDIRRIARAAHGHLSPGGWLLLEHGFDQAERIRALLRERKYAHVASRRDLSDHERVTGGSSC